MTNYNIRQGFSMNQRQMKPARAVGLASVTEKNPLLDRASVEKQPLKSLRPLLAGVCHGPERENEEISWLLRLAEASGARTVGIELADDYKKMKALGMGSFFYRIAELLEGNGLKPVALETRRHLDFHDATEFAKAFFEGSIPVGHIACGVAEGRRNGLPDMRPDIYTSPEMKRQISNFRILELALELIWRANGIEEVRMAWSESNRIRDGFMLERIRTLKPDMIVVGDGHAIKMAPVLSGYEYVKSDFL